MKASRLDSGRAITAEETDEFGVDHANPGARLAQSWLPPEETTVPIELHRDTDLLCNAAKALNRAVRRP